MLNEENKLKFNLLFVKTIDAWLQFGASDRRVLNNIAKIEVPNEFKIFHGPLYRVMKLSNVNDFKNNIPTSWTFNKDIARKFSRNATWFNDIGSSADYFYLFYIKTPKPNNIILNIDKLMQNAEFLDIAYEYEKQGKINGVGIGTAGHSQDEIIYKANLHEVHSIYKRITYKNWKKIK